MFHGAIQNWLLSEKGVMALQRTIVLCLLLGSSYQLAQISWRVLPTPVTIAPNRPDAHAIASTNAKDNQQQRLAVIRNAQLFGLDAPAPKSVSTSAPKSRLNAQLTGIMASSIASRSLAIIARNGQQQSYVISDVIQGTDARIDNILPDRVLITRQGQQEALYLDENTANLPAAPAIIANQSLPDIRQKLLKNPGQLMDYLTITPVKENNQLRGYRLNPGRDPAIFAQLGLQANDLAISINGLDLRNNVEAMQAMQQLSHQTEMNISVERNGETQDIYVNLAQP